MHRARWACQVKNVPYFDIKRKPNRVTDEFIVCVTKERFYVFLRSGIKVVNANNLLALRK